MEGLEAAPLEVKEDKSVLSSAKELRSSFESVNIEEVRLWFDDKKAEAALRSSSRSETVNKELPIDLVISEAVDNCTDNQSSEQNPDSNEPRRFHKYMLEELEVILEAEEPNLKKKTMYKKSGTVFTNWTLFRNKRFVLNKMP